MRDSLVVPCALLVAAAAAAGCGPDLSLVVPSGPSTLAPFLQQDLVDPQLAPQVAQVEGVWSGPLFLLEITGGTGIVSGAGATECVWDVFLARTGTANTFSLVIDQSGTDLTARLISAETGLAGTYVGSSSLTQVVLDAASWDTDELVIRCFDDEVRLMRLAGSSIVATVTEQTPTTLSGTVAHTYNVYNAMGFPVGGLVARYDFVQTGR